MNYADIKQYDVANGLGIRVSLFVSGCTHHCKNCFNKETWDFRFGNPFTEAEIEKILEYLKPSYVSGLSLLGGKSARTAATGKKSKRDLSGEKYLVLYRLSV